MVQNLFEKGLLTRERSLQDRREIQLALTAEGKAVSKKSFRSFQETLSEALTQMNPSDQQKLAALLEELCKRSGIIQDELTMFFEDETGKPSPRANKATRAKKASR